MKQQILKPENWQDFEELCKVLWSEIWECPEIKKNGRFGQNQNGVDIYGIPKNETKYFGIQCKGKDEYTKSKLTELEITSEINKAKNFKPYLKKLYIATTANKDERIEELVKDGKKQGYLTYEQIVKKTNAALHESKLTLKYCAFQSWKTPVLAFNRSTQLSLRR